MIILGIETSCDETSAAIIKNGNTVLSHIVASSIQLHKKYGGIIPEIASRAQLEFIYPVVDEALKKAKVKIDRVNLIAVTKGPGLGGSLLVGVTFAKALSFAKNIPLIGVDHIKAHLYAPLLTQKIAFPFIGLVISGGHTSLYRVADFDAFTLLGRTADDAAGEAFDKVAKILGLGYPGGPVVEKIALKGEAGKVKFFCGNLKREFDFSFSGIKTAVLYNARQKKLTAKNKADIAYAFQETVFNDIVKKSVLAASKKKIKSIVIGGGVSCNRRFRDKLSTESAHQLIKVYLAEPQYCTDNAAMIAGFGYQLFKLGFRSKLSMKIEPA